MPKIAVVTGASGYIASELVKQLLEKVSDLVDARVMPQMVPILAQHEGPSALQEHLLKSFLAVLS